MRMMLKKHGLASLLCVVLLGAGAWPSHAFAATDDEDDRAEFKLISEGLGIKGVYVWRSTERDVIAAYGEDYDLIKHGSYTYELRYVLLDLSFYYCQDDPQKRIFDIECRAGFPGFTAKGIVLGKSTVRDVFKAYGVSPELESFPNNSGVFFESPGIQFSVAYEEDAPPLNLKRLLDRKVETIDIVTSKAGSDCLPPNLK